MLTCIGRAAARRITTSAASTRFSQLISHHSPAVSSPAATVRAFTVSAWGRLPASKVTPKTSSKKSTTPAKKTVAKKTAAKDKTKAKAKAKATAKEIKPKTASSKKEKKVLTQEEKDKLEIRELKKWALLTKITGLPESAWIVFTSQNMKSGVQDLPARMKELSQKFKNLYSYEREPLEKTAASNRITNEANYKDWVQSHPVEHIYLANKARRRLARKTGKTIRAIRDDRLPKAPGSAYSAFVKARYNESGFNQPLAETMKLLSAEWKSLNETKKRSYEEKVAQDASAYSAKLDTIKSKAKELQDITKTEEKAAAQAKAEAQKQARAEARLKAKAE